MSNPITPSGARFTADDMQAFGLECALDGAPSRIPKLPPAVIADIRNRHWKGAGYKEVNKLYPMGANSFYQIVRFSTNSPRWGKT